MKKLISLITLLALLLLGVCACDTTDSQSQGSGSATPSNDSLGNYEIVIDSCRLATDYMGEPIVIVKYKFTNNDDDPTAFMWTFSYEAYQDGIGLNQSIFVDESANYSSDNQTKEIKKGASLFVEVAYDLNDTTSDVEIEVSELFSFSNKKITKTFTIK